MGNNVRYGSLADIGEGFRDVRFTPQKRTYSSSASMSAKCHKRTFHVSGIGIELSHRKGSALETSALGH